MKDSIGLLQRDCLSPFLTVSLGQAWHRYFCQFRKVEGRRKLREMKLIPVGHHGLVSKPISEGKGEWVGKVRENAQFTVACNRRISGVHKLCFTDSTVDRFCMCISCRVSITCTLLSYIFCSCVSLYPQMPSTDFIEVRDCVRSKTEDAERRFCFEVELATPKWVWHMPCK